jgi:hypothetical protein
VNDPKRQVFVTRRKSKDVVSLTTPSGDKIDLTIHQTKANDVTLIIQASDDTRIAIKKHKEPEVLVIRKVHKEV